MYSHFPEDCRWQLLPKQLTLAQFESLPLTKSQFFKCGMDFRGEHHGVVQAVDGCIRMTLGFWKPGAFTYKLQHLLGSANDPQPALLAARSTDLVDSFLVGHEKTPLKDFVLQETTPDALNFFFRLPTRGVFYLTIYALVGVILTICASNLMDSTVSLKYLGGLFLHNTVLNPDNIYGLNNKKELKLA